MVGTLTWTVLPDILRKRLRIRLITVFVTFVIPLFILEGLGLDVLVVFIIFVVFLG